MTRDLTEAEVDSLNQEMEDTLTSFHFKDLPTWLTKNIHEETTTKSGDACWFAFKKLSEKTKRKQALWELPASPMNPLFLAPVHTLLKCTKSPFKNAWFVNSLFSFF